MATPRAQVRPIGDGEALVSVPAHGGWYQLLVPVTVGAEGPIDRAQLDDAVRAAWQRRFPELALGDLAFERVAFDSRT